MNYLKLSIELLVILTIGVSIMFVTERQEMAQKKAEEKEIARQLAIEAKKKLAIEAQSPYRDKVEEAIANADRMVVFDEEKTTSSLNTAPDPDFFEFEENTKISFAKRGLTGIDEAALKPYRNCKLLDLSHNQLQKLPTYLSKMDYLEVLILDNNQFTELPYILQKCKRLRFIYANNNPIKNIRCNFNKMHTINFIGLQNTKFSQLPKFPDRSDLSVILTAKDYGQKKMDNLYEYTGKRYRYTYFEFL